MVGNIPNYTKYDILRCFLRLSRSIGRQELSRELGLGEGTVRTILESLKSKNLLDSTKRGHFPSKDGVSELRKIISNIDGPKIIDSKDIYPEYKKICVLLRKSRELREIYKLRDIAVKNLAEGALILKFNNKLYAPDSEYKGNFDDLKNYFEIKNGNILIIAFAEEAKDAETGALAVGVELNDALRRFINKF